jgi:Fe2+ transport system protein FeoA
MSICPLTQLQVGDKCRIKEVIATPECQKRLKELGFLTDVEMKVVSKTWICEICQAKFGICSELASKILVEKDE